jgi:multiple sugar transport system substrate-binding protein
MTGQAAKIIVRGKKGETTMATSLTRRRLLASAAIAPMVGTASAADFDWKRFNGSQLRFMVSVHPWTEWAQKQLPALEAETGIKVNLEILYEDQLRQKLPLTLRSDPGAVDAFFTLPSWDGASFARARWYAPLEPLIASDLTAPDWDFSDFFPNILNIHRLNGQLLGIPISTEVQALFFNKAMLDAKGLAPPTTLDTLMAAAKALNDPAGNVAGFVTRGDGVQALYTFAPFLFAYGGRWLDDNGKPELGGAPFINALKYYSEILRAAGPPNVLGMQWKTTYPLFQQERAALFADAVNFLAYFRDPSQSRIVDKVGMVPVPAGPSGSHSTVIAWGPAIAASSKQQQAAWTAIQWLTSKRNMLAASLATTLPSSRKSVFSADAYVKAAPAGVIEIVQSQIPNAVPNGANPLVVQVPETRAAIGQAIIAALRGEDITKAANEAQKQVLAIING